MSIFDRNDEIFDGKLNQVERLDYTPLADHVNKFVLIGANLLGHMDSYSNNELYHMTTLGLFRHIIVNLDSIVDAIKKGNSECVASLGRSVFEGTMYLLFILDNLPDKADTQIDNQKQRALAYQYFALDDQRKLYIKIRDQEPNFVRNMGSANLTNQQIQSKHGIDIATKVTNLENFLGNDEFQQIQTLKDNSLNKKPQWFNIFPGNKHLNNLSDLSHGLNQAAYYQIYYKKMCEHVHAGAANLNFDIKSNTAELYQIHRGADIESYTQAILHPIYLIFESIINSAYNPVKQSFKDEYDRFIQPFRQ